MHGDAVENTVPAAPPDLHSSSDEYAGRFAGPVGKWFLGVQENMVLEFLRSLPSNARLLDVGGGHGQLAPALIEAGYQVTVIGSDKRCGRRLARWTRDGSCRFEVGDLLRLPYADRSFDAVLSFRIISHVDDWRRLIYELCRVARQAVLLDFPSRASVNILARPLFSLKNRFEKNTRPFSLFWPAEIAREFTASGFGDATLRAQFFFPMVLHRVVGSRPFSITVEGIARRAGLTRFLGSPVIVRAHRTTGQDPTSSLSTEPGVTRHVGAEAMP